MCQLTAPPSGRQNWNGARPQPSHGHACGLPPDATRVQPLASLTQNLGLVEEGNSTFCDFQSWISSSLVLRRNDIILELNILAHPSHAKAAFPTRTCHILESPGTLKLSVTRLQSTLIRHSPWGGSQVPVCCKAPHEAPRYTCKNQCPRSPRPLCCPLTDCHSLSLKAPLPTPSPLHQEPTEFPFLLNVHVTEPRQAGPSDVGECV